MKTKKPIAIVTGAGAGIGLSICKELGAKGFFVIGAEQNPDRLHPNLENCEMLQLDVSDSVAVGSFIDHVIAKFGTPMACINNAGIIHRAPITKTNPDEFQRVIQVNLVGTYNLTHFFANALIKAGASGHIVNLSSGHAVLAGFNRAAYAASKAGIEALTRNSALELGKHGILVNAIAPGFTKTEMSSQSLVGDKLEKVKERLPIGRVAESQEVATTVHTLITGKIPYLTGQVIRIDGGWSNSDINYEL